MSNINHTAQPSNNVKTDTHTKELLKQINQINHVTYKNGQGVFKRLQYLMSISTHQGQGQHENLNAHTSENN